MRPSPRLQGTTGPAGSKVIVASGPPLAGKTTFVQTHKRPGDLVLDWDALAVALGSPVSHDHDPALRPVIAAARDAVLEKVRRGYRVGRVWIITTRPDLHRSWPGAEHIALEVDQAEAHRRCDQDGRPPTYHAVIDRYYGTTTPQPAHLPAAPASSRTW